METHTILTKDTLALRSLLTKSRLHSKVVGDIDASFKKVQKKNLTRIIGTIAHQEIVPTNTCVPYDYNRDTNVSWATKCLADEDGFNWQLFGSIEGIRNHSTGEIEIWDGLGRLAMAQLADIPSIPVIVHDQGSPGALFVKKQKLRNRTLNPEAHFVSYASALSGTRPIMSDSDDKKIENELKTLKLLNLRVESGINNYFPQGVSTTLNPKISISALRRSLKVGKVAELKLARDMIVGAYPKADELGKELFEGCVFLFAACPAAGKNGTYKSLCTFLQSMNTMPQNKLPFKQLGGNQHNDEARSVALGLWEMWSKADCSIGSPRTVLRKKHIEDFAR